MKFSGHQKSAEANKLSTDEDCECRLFRQTKSGSDEDEDADDDDDELLCCDGYALNMRSYLRRMQTSSGRVEAVYFLSSCGVNSIT